MLDLVDLAKKKKKGKARKKTEVYRYYRFDTLRTCPQTKTKATADCVAVGDVDVSSPSNAL